MWNGFSFHNQLLVVGSLNSSWNSRHEGLYLPINDVLHWSFLLMNTGTLIVVWSVLHLLQTQQSGCDTQCLCNIGCLTGRTRPNMHFLVDMQVHDGKVYIAWVRKDLPSKTINHIKFHQWIHKVTNFQANVVKCRVSSIQQRKPWNSRTYNLTNETAAHSKTEIFN